MPHVCVWHSEMFQALCLPKIDIYVRNVEKLLFWRVILAVCEGCMMAKDRFQDARVVFVAKGGFEVES